MRIIGRRATVIVPAFGWLAIVELLAVVELLAIVELLEPE
jgi:hypothetical protein